MNIYPNFTLRLILRVGLMAISVLVMERNLRGDDLRTQLEMVDNLSGFKAEDGDFRIYYIGDSITRHRFNNHTISKLKWDHCSGMAASSEDLDFAHLVAEGVAKYLPDRKVRIFFGPGREPAFAITGIKLLEKYAPDLVVVQLGEHIPSHAYHDEHNQSADEIEKEYKALLEALVNLPSSPLVICTGVWNPVPNVEEYFGRDAQIDEIQRGVCNQMGIPFVSVEKYALDPSCSGTGGSGPVRWHPNDKGHAGYAREILEAFYKNF